MREVFAHTRNAGVAGSERGRAVRALHYTVLELHADFALPFQRRHSLNLHSNGVGARAVPVLRGQRRPNFLPRRLEHPQLNRPHTYAVATVVRREIVRVVHAKGRTPRAKEGAREGNRETSQEIERASTKNGGGTLKNVCREVRSAPALSATSHG